MNDSPRPSVPVVLDAWAVLVASRPDTRPLDVCDLRRLTPLDHADTRDPAAIAADVTASGHPDTCGTCGARGTAYACRSTLDALTVQAAARAVGASAEVLVAHTWMLRRPIGGVAFLVLTSIPWAAAQ